MLRDFNAPDVKARRFRPGTLTFLNKEFYQLVRSSNPVLRKLTDAQIKEIILIAGQVIQNNITKHRDGVSLPEQLGTLFLGSVPATKEGNVDYKKSIELGKMVHYQNWDTDNLTGKIFYTNYETRYRFKYHECWQFKAARQFKKNASKAFQQDHNKFIRTDNHAKVSRLFRKQRTRQQAAEQTNQHIKAMPAFQEFDLD